MAFKIFWSPQAIDDLRDLTEFIAQDDAVAAENVGLAIISKVRALTARPQLGRIVPERNDSRVREIFHVPWRIVYRVNQRERLVEILRIWHGARGEPQI